MIALVESLTQVKQ